MSHKSVAHSRTCRFYWAFSNVSELFPCKFPLSPSVSLSPFNVAPLMKSGGSVIFSIVLRVSLLPNSSRSSQNSAGPTDRNSLPCRYQSLPLLTIILICLSLLFSLPKPQRLLPTLRQQGFTVIVADSRIRRFISAGFCVTKLCDVTSSGSVQDIII